MESKAWRDEVVKLRWDRIKKGFVSSESGFYLEHNKELRQSRSRYAFPKEQSVCSHKIKLKGEQARNLFNSLVRRRGGPETGQWRGRRHSFGKFQVLVGDDGVGQKISQGWFQISG